MLLAPAAIYRSRFPTASWLALLAMHGGYIPLKISYCMLIALNSGLAKALQGLIRHDKAYSVYEAF